MSDRPLVSVFIATSLDGFIARDDGSIDWLMEANKMVPDGEDCGYAAFFETVDCMVMGRNTFETVLDFDPWPYGDRRIEVLSRSGVDVPQALSATVRSSAESPSEIVARLGREGVRHVYLDGGRLISAFLAEGLVDSMTITTIPVLIGSGRPLFTGLPGDVALRPTGRKDYDFGFLQTVWEPLNRR